MLDLCSQESVLGRVVVVFLFQLLRGSLESLDITFVSLARPFCRQVVLLSSLVVPCRTQTLLEIVYSPGISTTYVLKSWRARYCCGSQGIPPSL